MTRTLLGLGLSGKVLLTKLLYTGHPYQTWYRHLISLIVIIMENVAYTKMSRYNLFFQRERRDKDRDSDMWHDRSRHSEIGFCRSPIPLVDGKRHPHTNSHNFCVFRWQISNPNTNVTIFVSSDDRFPPTGVNCLIVVVYIDTGPGVYVGTH